MGEGVAPASAGQRVVRVVESVRLARDTYRIRLEDPELARTIEPGQFVMVRPTLGTDPFLGRPFALYDVIESRSGEPFAVDLVYLVLGKGTAALAERSAGDRVMVWGPLGHPFGPPPAGGDAVFVAGGIGQTPFVALGQWWRGTRAYGGRSWASAPARSATLLYGARSADLLAGLDDFARAGVEVEVATDDGSTGHRGFVTDLLSQRLKSGQRPGKVVGCGPPAMLAALTRLVTAEGVPCDLSLENHMACGFGVCFSCVAPIRQPDGSVDLRRVCVEGPVFPAETVVW